MKHSYRIRYIIIASILLLGVVWSIGSAGQNRGEYPNSRFLATAQWLHTHLKDEKLVIADVRSNDHFSGGVIPGAVRMPWSEFRYNDTGQDIASGFVGVNQAQQILGRHGITPQDTVVLYDSVERDGGATASYLFWILDILGHENIKILERGIDGWKDAGFDLATQPQNPKALLYQAGFRKIKRDRLINGEFVYKQLGDPYYQIIDVRSEKEYLGKAGTKGLDGTPFKLGHIPTAVNINYTSAWSDLKTKQIQSYNSLAQLYKGVDPSMGIIVYCNSGRRSSFSYYILRLMGFENVYTYEASWKEWGNPDKFFPVETEPRELTGQRHVSIPGQKNRTGGSPAGQSTQTSPDGYISCGG